MPLIAKRSSLGAFPSITANWSRSSDRGSGINSNPLPFAPRFICDGKVLSSLSIDLAVSGGLSRKSGTQYICMI